MGKQLQHNSINGCCSRCGLRYSVKTSYVACFKEGDTFETWFERQCEEVKEMPSRQRCQGQRRSQKEGRFTLAVGRGRLMAPPCDSDCVEAARREFEHAKKFGLLAEVIWHYRFERKHGACPHVAAWRGCYE